MLKRRSVRFESQEKASLSLMRWCHIKLLRRTTPHLLQSNLLCSHSRIPMAWFQYLLRLRSCKSLSIACSALWSKLRYEIVHSMLYLWFCGLWSSLLTHSLFHLVPFFVLCSLAFCFQPLFAVLAHSSDVRTICCWSEWHRWIGIYCRPASYASITWHWRDCSGRRS